MTTVEPRADLPPELIEALERGELILCLGPALAVAAGLPTEGELVAALCADAETRGLAIDGEALRTLAAADRGAEALELLERHMGPRFVRIVERELGERGRPPSPLALAVAALADRLRAVYTTGLDRQLERAFADAWPSFAGARGDLAQRRQIIVKLRGTLEFPETWVLTQSRIEREWGPHSLRRELLGAAARAHCLLFVGFDPSEPTSRRLLTMVAGSVDEQSPLHFLCLPDCGDEQRALLEARNLAVIPEEPLALLEGLRGRTRGAPEDNREALPSCPYPGLQAFDQSLASVFHGRRAEVSMAASRLGGPEPRHRRWLAVEGSSGVGKSSFVHAGLVPALRRGFAEATPGSWCVATLRPGHRPMQALLEALGAALD
ncbi:MAG: SIR2 family protein, partial [Myxococcales bacterium]|nr:SIR2 family protein [Myxococcales bacterium]